MTTRRIKLGIFTEPSGWEVHYIRACQELGVDFTVIDVVADQLVAQRADVQGLVDGFSGEGCRRQ
jgi:hypothetical protein